MGVTWHTWKMQLEALTDISRDAMHVHASVAIFLAACLLLKLRPSDWRAWLIVLAMQCANEALDMLAMIEDDGVIYWWPCIKDTINTMILPTVLVLVARYTELFDGPAVTETSAPEPEDSSD